MRKTAFLLLISAFSLWGNSSLTEWFGIYLNNVKIGYTYLEIKKENTHYKVIERTYMNLKMLGQEKNLTTFLTAYGKRDFSLDSYRFELLTGDQRVASEGKVEGKKLTVRFKTQDGVERTKEFNLEGKVYVPPLLEAALINNMVPSGEFMLYDPSTFSIDRATLNFVGKEKVTHRGKEVDALVYESSYMNITSKTYVANGKIIKLTSPLNIVSVEESESEATKIGEEKVDLLYLFAIVPEGDLGNPREIKSLTLKIEGVSLKGLDLQFGNQRLVKRGKNWAILRYTKDGGSGPQNIKDYLRPTAFLQSDDPKIIELARDITYGSRNDEEKARKILDWVYRNLEKRPTVTLPTALDVLRMGYGDCNEHSVLFAALARAAGIPTEIIVGLVYQEGAYYYHAWDAVYINGKWTFVDPIFGEFPALPTHLMLKHGEIEKQAELLPVVGKLRIKILKKS